MKEYLAVVVGPFTLSRRKLIGPLNEVYRESGGA
jgi:hypothetical protein